MKTDGYTHIVHFSVALNMDELASIQIDEEGDKPREATPQDVAFQIMVRNYTHNSFTDHEYDEYFYVGSYTHGGPDDNDCESCTSTVMGIMLANGEIIEVINPDTLEVGYKLNPELDTGDES